MAHTLDTVKVLSSYQEGFFSIDLPMQNITKRYYSISETANLLELSDSKLRFWEEQFPSLNPKRDRGGGRRYTENDIQHIKEIKRLLEIEGMTIEGAKRSIEKNKQKRQQTQKIVARLEEIKDFLVQLRNALQDTPTNE